MKLLDITFDLETTSLSANAAILQIGAVAWDRENRNTPFIVSKKDEGDTFFLYNVALNGQFVGGCDFDRDTQEWWQEQDEKVKQTLNGKSDTVEKSIGDFFGYIDRLKKSTNADEVNLWCQGPDTDIAILKSAMSRFMGVKLHDFPIEHTRFRDARTFVLEGGLAYAIVCARRTGRTGGYLFDVSKNEWCAIKNEWVKNPNMVYKYIPEIPKETTDILNSLVSGGTHNALCDAIRSTWNVWCIMNQYIPTDKD